MAFDTHSSLQELDANPLIYTPADWLHAKYGNPSTWLTIFMA